MHKIDLFIFDLDGTLADTRLDLTNSVNYARERLGLPALDVEAVIKYVGNGVRRLMERSLPEEKQDKIDEAISHFRSHYKDHALVYTKLYPGVKEVLSHFQSKKMAVISNKPEEFSRNILRGLEVDTYFELILGGDSLPVMKPNPEPILKLLAALNTMPDKTVIVGDGTTDIEAGKHAKILTCAVTYGFKKKEILLPAQPDFMVDDILELKRLFG
ncbi:MAG: HAD family hydrolase [bacterium]